ncbi:MAG: MerR family transcriptional regulator [Pseudomonadota bacterium]
MASTDFSLFSYEESDTKKEKAPGALRTISEASELLDVPQHVLRFWETKFTQIKPLKRNGGRRFYRPQDLDILQQIKHLLYNQGYTIKGAKKAVDDFIHARAERPVNNAEWLAAIPPASVNDNFEATAEPDMLAQIAQALAEPEEEVATAIVESPSRDSLIALRAELVQARDNLRVYLPAMTQVVQ